MFDVRVKTLLAVTEAESCAKAAQKLNLAQSAVNHQIRLLENEFDIKILYRSKSKPKLTPQGKILVQYARRATAVYSNTCQAIVDSKTETSHLSVGITLTAGEITIPQVLAILYSENPDIHISVYVNTIQKIYSHLKAYELDFAMMKDGVPDTVLVSTTLDTDYPCPVVSPVHRLGRAKAVSVEEIYHEKLILRDHSTGTRRLFERHLGVKGMSPVELNVIMELDNVSMIKELVTMDLGVTTIAKSAYREELASGCLAVIPIKDSSMVRQIDIVYQEDFLHPELTRSARSIYEQLKAKWCLLICDYLFHFCGK